MPNLKSDVAAKKALCERLIADGFESAVIKGSPADVLAMKNGEQYYFEVKYTRQLDRYFGAATLTEWIAAVTHADRFRFVIASERDGSWVFNYYTPDEFMAHSYIPPFKVYFNVRLHETSTSGRRIRPHTAVSLTREHLDLMSTLFTQMRGAQSVAPSALRLNAGLRADPASR